MMGEFKYIEGTNNKYKIYNLGSISSPKEKNTVAM